MAYLVLQSHGFHRKSVPGVPLKYLTDHCNSSNLAVDHEPNSVSSAVSIRSNRTLCDEERAFDKFSCHNVITTQNSEFVTSRLFSNTGIQTPRSITPAQSPKLRKKSSRGRPDSGYSTTDGPGGGSPQSEDPHPVEHVKVDQVTCNGHSDGNSDGTDLTMRFSPQHSNSPLADEELLHTASKKMSTEREAEQPKRPFLTPAYWFIFQINNHTVQKTKQQTNRFSSSRESVRFASHRFAGRPSQTDGDHPSRRSQSATGYRSTCLKRATDHADHSQTTVNPKLPAWVTTGPPKRGTSTMGHTTGKPNTPRQSDSASQLDRSIQQPKSSTRFQRATRPRTPSAANTRSVMRHGEMHEVAMKQRRQVSFYLSSETVI
ncbi:hypothetical protein P879_07499 [Paragonimus westermani]|uniref:Uncharacterized protein n=1 Tax=Paragonimus westermani TaxID=34504 RepID=A0A8T0DHV0_9TREM|nr:hypothetical protein P879_07499 [Paragonimus westermani]